MAVLKATVLASLASAAVAKSVPSNLQNLLNSITSQGSCHDQLASGFYSEDNDGGSKFVFKKRVRETYSVI